MGLLHVDHVLGQHYFVKEGVILRPFLVIDKNGHMFDVLCRIKRSGVVNLVLLPQAYDDEGEPLSSEWTAVFVQEGQSIVLADLLQPFVEATLKADRKGVSFDLFGKTYIP